MHLLKIKLYFYVDGVLHLCTIFVPGACGDEKRESDLVELELQVIVSHHVSAGN